MKRTLPFLVLMALPFLSSAQTPVSSNADPKVFIPKGWVAFAEAKGDLNKDSIPDIAMVVGTPEKSSADGSRMRSLLILFGNSAGQYVQSSIGHRAVPDAFTPGRNMETFKSLKIAKNVVIIDYAWETGARKFVLLQRYRFQNNDFFLIGNTYTAKEGTETYTYDYNVSNGKMILSVKNSANAAGNKTVNAEKKLTPLPLLGTLSYETITDLLVETGKKSLGGYISDTPEVVSTCTLVTVGLGDCSYMSFSCGEFGDAEIALSEADHKLWGDLTVDTNSSTMINPKYLDASFVMTYHEIQAPLCGDPSGPIEIGTTYKLTGFRLASPLVARPTIPLEGLIAWYGFRAGSMTDQSGSTGDGENNGATPTSDRFGKTSGANYFNGKSHITLIPPFPKIAVPLTVAGWFKLDGDGEAMQTILSLGRSSDGTAFNFGVDISRNNTAYFGIIGEKPINVEKAGVTKGWHFLSATISETQSKIYVDGVLAGTTDISPADIDEFKYNLGQTNQPPEIGRELETLDRHFKGSIDEVIIYNRALSDAEIKSLYDGLGH